MSRPVCPFCGQAVEDIGVCVDCLAKHEAEKRGTRIVNVMVALEVSAEVSDEEVALDVLSILVDTEDCSYRDAVEAAVMDEKPDMYVAVYIDANEGETSADILDAVGQSVSDSDLMDAMVGVRVFASREEAQAWVDGFKDGAP
jgi:hypothetical protein